MSDYYCPNCGADLEDQPGFLPSNGYWTCTQCGTLLTDPNDPDFDTPSGATWFCDECGACLNKQFGFSEIYDSWTCTECGHTNPINEDEIYESEEAFQEEKARRESYSYSYDSYDDEDDDDEDDEDDDEDDDNSYSYSYSSSSSYHSVGIIDSIKDFFSTVWKWIKRIFFCSVALCILCTGWMIYDHISSREAAKIDNRVPIGISSSDAIGKDYKEIEKQLESAGFSYIVSYELYDLDYSDKNKVGTIGEISVDGKETFFSSSKFENNDRIVIKYHSLKHENPPMTSKEAKKQNYNDVVNAFKTAGFGNIKLVQEKDLITGWVTKDGAVESVAIDGDTKYKTISSFSVDTEITITYHTFKDK